MIFEGSIDDDLQSCPVMVLVDANEDPLFVDNIQQKFLGLLMVTFSNDQKT